MIRKILTNLAVILVASAIVVPSTVFAFNPFGNTICSGTDTASSAVCQEQQNSSTNPLTGPNGLFVGISKIIAVIAGISAVIVIVISGMRFITSGGDPAKAKAARESLAPVLIGLVVIVLAGSIISFVLSRL